MKQLYLIFARDVGRVKIGLSSDPNKRLQQLQTSAPVNLELFAFKKFKNAPIKETTLHERFKHKRVHGEWFELDDIDYVQLLKEWDFDPGLHYIRKIGTATIKKENSLFIAAT